MKPEIKLSNWKITNEFGFFHLVGLAHDHPKLGTTNITTSKLVNVDFKNMKAETLNSIYLLEDV